MDHQERPSRGPLFPVAFPEGGRNVHLNIFRNDFIEIALWHGVDVF